VELNWLVLPSFYLRHHTTSGIDTVNAFGFWWVREKKDFDVSHTTHVIAVTFRRVLWIKRVKDLWFPRKKGSKEVPPNGSAQCSQSVWREILETHHGKKRGDSMLVTMTVILDDTS
jgi:hypothetical protein